MEELWSRLIVLRGHADSLRDQINKPGFAESEGMGEEIEAKAKKVSHSDLYHSYLLTWEIDS
jgi:nuclear pore complex protein Nup54